MDENENLNQPLPPSATTVKERFKGFALYHLLYSLFFFTFFVCFVSFSYFLDAIPIETRPAMAVQQFILYLSIPLSMVLYFPLGMWKAKRGRWTVPSGKELCLAVALPCLVSVTWALLFPLSIEVIQLYLLISAIFAAPSSFFVIYLSLLLDPYLLNWVGFTVALLSAVLPPLLFALGSFWQAKRQNFSHPA